MEAAAQEPEPVGVQHGEKDVYDAREDQQNADREKQPLHTRRLNQYKNKAAVIKPAPRVYLMRGAGIRCREPVKGST
jgi:hypothetical protein